MKDKMIISMQKNIREYKAILLDVDGTLYDQTKLRLHMAAGLAFHYICHPFRIRELLVLKRYREVREQWEDTGYELSGSSLEDAQYRYVAEQMHTTAGEVKRVISFWIYTKPLSLLPRCMDTELIRLLSLLRKDSVTIAVYSDYPAKDKLAAMHITADYIFCSSDPDINCMKPNPKAMQAILRKLRLDAGDVLMIGDRYSKDGMAAKNIGMDYIVLTKSMPLRSRTYRSLIP